MRSRELQPDHAAAFSAFPPSRTNNQPSHLPPILHTHIPQFPRSIITALRNIRHHIIIIAKIQNAVHHHGGWGMHVLDDNAPSPRFARCLNLLLDRLTLFELGQGIAVKVNLGDLELVFLFV